MGKRHTNQEWQTLIEQSESSSLSTLAFCKLNELNPSTFYAKRQQLKKADVSQGFVRAEVVEKTTKYQAQIATANMTLLINDVELSIPQGTGRTHWSLVMKHMLSAPEIYLYRESVDFRKSINGLAAIIESDTDLPLGSGALFLFTNKQRDKIKVLYWDKTGFALWYKRLEKAKYKWPTKERNEVFTLTQFELDRLLSGFTIIGHKPVQINDFTMT
ncbi:hypothetical protein M892_16190 [Vibrio campbellii ATCC BAA-1116]|nr:hypothetical protein M892_02865 [Vibrio campbellii ATCC BAA-1116]AGU96930.1 hypothetical protein M892_16190 [Vibrio campbellii ATCC BAA-1116]